MKDLAPDIFRQRLLVEGYFSAPVDAAWLEQFLLGLAAKLELRTYARPVVFAPASGAGREENAGYDAFVPLIDSGISAYVWSQPRFFSLMLYTCKGFDAEAAIAYAREAFGVEGEIASARF